ncbi:hypothetical protein [Streptomyces sp. H39-S7]|uniref:hypothetical protein n=1 Tax=Streptomyces sp. H39-S7 TaxID=3004357 RepID=UPI0022AEFC64|nr:hypothetical protein [Streptomyces sp. H39-S7]MCZ4123420.1 hypothetical protein [Streptomyces sp. H39-S7]
MGKRAVLGRALAGAAVALTAVSACAGPHQYYEGSGFHGATVAEAQGVWQGVGGTRLSLRPDGTALFQRLDGHDFDFDAGWRLSGTGTWELTDPAAGQDLQVAMATRTKVETRVPGTPTAAWTPEPPARYTWHFSVRRDARQALELFFFFGDPDSGNTYVVQRAAPPESVSSPPTAERDHR